MSFVNTVDIIGDEALTHSILNGSITEIADNRVTSVGDSAFRGCSALIKADFPSVTGIYNTAFHDCSSLVTLALRSETMCVLYYTSSFDGSPIANGTGYIYVPGALLDSYKADSKWSAYANQFRVLEHYTVDGTITGEIDPTRCRARFFNGDTLLQEIYVPYGTVPVYTGEEIVPEVDYAFVGWVPEIAAVTGDVDYVAQFKFTKSITRSILDKTITEYSSETITSIEQYAFTKCTKLVIVNAPSATTIGSKAFDSCSALTSADFPNVTTISDNAFRQLGKLVSVDLPNATSIGNYVFQNCYKLESANIPSVTRLGQSAFNNCQQLMSVRLPAAPPSIQGATFTGINSQCVFYIPTGSLAAYQSETNWSSLTSTYSFVEEDR
jgi:hypothetical protein